MKVQQQGREETGRCCCCCCYSQPNKQQWWMFRCICLPTYRYWLIIAAWDFNMISRHFDVRIFTTWSSYASAVLVIVILSDRPSVCHMRALWRDERTYCRYFDTTEVSGRWPLSPEICAWKTCSDSCRDVCSHREVSIRVNSKVSNDRHGQNSCVADTYRSSWNLMLTSSRCTPKDLGLGRIELQPVRHHTLRHVIDADRQTLLKRISFRWTPILPLMPPYGSKVQFCHFANKSGH